MTHRTCFVQSTSTDMVGTRAWLLWFTTCQRLLTLQLPGLVLKAHYADAEALARTVAQWGQPSAFNKERATQGRACMVPW